MATQNPLRDGFRIGPSPEPVSFVIFGASGDLTARKLLPAIYSLAVEDRLPPTYLIVGFARRPWTHQEFRAELMKGIVEFSRYNPNDQSGWERFSENIYFVTGSFEDHKSFSALDDFLQATCAARNMPDNRLYYLAAPPTTYQEIISNLGQARMSHDADGGWRRIVIEKPFGRDLESARELNRVVHKSFSEKQVFRIDHYLGKETVQNILVLRFANTIFEPIWNRQYVDHVQISVAESVGVGGRAGYYEQAGVVRDIFQNHIMQLLSLIAMEPPVAFEADAIRDEKVKVLRALRRMGLPQIRADTVRAQYSSGVAEGQAVVAYVEEPGVAAKSTTPTYAAFKTYIDNWRWQDIPFYLRSGKRLATRATEVSIHFKRPPHLLFRAMDDEQLRANVLALRIQPDEGVSLRTEAKMPGQGFVRRSVTLDFRYGTSFGIEEPPDAYERLLLDAILGDATLFARSDEIEWAWAHIDPILEAWGNGKVSPLQVYESGTWGPDFADKLLERDGRKWRRL